MTKRELKNFLRSRGAYTKFKLNMKAQDRGTVSNLSTCSIACAFIWENTPEGSDYWSKLYEELLDLRQQQRLNKHR